MRIKLNDKHKISKNDKPYIIAEILVKMIRNGATGLYNIGTDTKTVFALAQKTNPEVKGVLAPNDFPKDLIMDLSKMKKFLDAAEKE